MRRSLAIAAIGSAIAFALIAVWIFWRTPAPPPPIAQTQAVESLLVTMQLDQTQLGKREITVLVNDPAGNAVDAGSVQLQFSMEEMDMGMIRADAERLAPGRFRASGSFFSMVGRWRVDATVVRDNASPQTVAFVFPIAAPGEASGPLNPLRPDEATLAAARTLYAANCAACHGPTGKGDGPAAVGLRPAPGDFTQHMQPGKHTDGQVYLWIRDGYPGTAMPAWREQLSEEQIWQLVTYLRTFGQSTTQTANATPPPATATPPTAAPEQVEPLPPLVFVRQDTIWRSDGTGAAPQAITTLETGNYAEYPTLAPNGEQIAFVATTQGPLAEGEWPLDNPQTSLYRTEADGTNLQLLWKPERGRLGLTAWSRDSQSIYVGLYDVRSAPDAPVLDRSFQIVQVDAQSGAQTVVMDDAFDLTFAADGTQIAFLRWHPDLARFTLNVAAPDGSNEREVVPIGAFSGLYAPRFSPDGQQLIFASTSGPPVDDQGVPIKETSQSPLDLLFGLVRPSSAEAHGAASELWIVNNDGSGLRRLTALAEDMPMAVFSPDGAEIVLMGAGGIYRMDADGSNTRKIDPLGDHGGLDWGAK